MTQKARGSTPVDRHVGRQLRLLRLNADLTQTDLASQAGVTFQQIQKYERGANRIGASRLWAFAQILQVSPAAFFDGLPTEQGQATPQTAGATAKVA